MAGHDSHSPRSKHMPRNFSVVAAIDKIRTDRDDAVNALRELVATLRADLGDQCEPTRISPATAMALDRAEVLIASIRTGK